MGCFGWKDLRVVGAGRAEGGGDEGVDGDDGQGEKGVGVRVRGHPMLEKTRRVREWSLRFLGGGPGGGGGNGDQRQLGKGKGRGGAGVGGKGEEEDLPPDTQ